MSRRPLRHEQVCPDCNGRGWTRAEDWDEYGSHVIDVRCEGCDGAGMLVDCHRCDEPMPLTEAELGGGVCGPCRAGIEMSDESAERARWRRVGS